MDEFDRLLYAGSAQLPPELTELKPPCPWKKPIGLICWGLALITITLNFFGLNIILPVVGTALLWLGLRPLRRENGGFHFSYACATLYAMLRLTVVLLRATPLDHWLTGLVGREWNTSTGPVSLYDALWLVLLQLVLVLAVGGLWRGLKGVFAQAGQKPRTAAAGGLVLLEALLIPLALIGLDGWLLVGPILILWICLVVGLRKLSKSLDQAGYILKPAPMRVSNGMALGVWLGFHLLIIAALPLLFSRLPVNLQTPVSDSVDHSALRAELLELGFPEDILSKLSDGELSKFQGAYGLTVKGQDDSSGSYPDGIPSVEMLEIPVQDNHYGFHTVYLAYLRWSAEEVSGGGYMEGIRITPDWQGVTVHTSCPSGTLEWRDRSGTSHTAPLSFHFRSDGSGTPSYYADFSLPKGVEGPVEGWVSWESAPAYPEKVTVYNYQLAFAHRLTPWQYPYRLPSDVLLSDNGVLGWRLNYQRLYTGQLAPNGQDNPRKD